MSFDGPLGIAGVGLIGGSIALRARKAGIEVIGFDTSPAAADLVDRSAGSLEALARASKTLVLALPLDATLSAIDIVRAIDAPDLVLDVASVKVPVVERTAGWKKFVATHPIAGAEQRGARAARDNLFEGRVWTYVPCDPQRDAAVDAFIRIMGARSYPIDAHEHDRVLALTSHLPQVVVTALAALLSEREIAPDLAGSGLASTLRLAGSPWEIWEPILKANGASIGAALRELSERLEGLADDVEAGTLRLSASYFESAHAAYDALVKPWR
ncbi:MAG: prephenate dehydrogenase/arogenate dehydrogenase family protein [Vulcanimicrobiaceae bacterium]